MDGMLSQDEINALLSGLDTSASVSEPEPPATDSFDGILSDMEKDAIGEVANISLGSSTTTLYSLVNRKVSITTPVVTIADWANLLSEYERPCVFIQIKYTKGLDGMNILVLRETDVKVITDLMMGGDGTNTTGELGELHLSAISEAMNQMMGASATSLSTMLGMMIDISPPTSTLLNLTDFHSANEVAPYLGEIFVKISFRMQIGDLVDSSIMQLYPIDFARKMVDTFMSTQMGGSPQETSQQTAAPPPAPTPSPPSTPPPMAADYGAMGMQQDYGMGGMNPQMMNPQMMNPQMMNPMMGAYPQMAMNPMMGMPPQNVNVAPAQFQTFTNINAVPGQENIGLIMDVPLEVTVELGRTTKSISEILSFSPGTIIELDRIAGEPIDVLVNGKFVARGEVVVIEESFGIRVTEIIK